LAVSAVCTKAKSALKSFGTIRKKLLLMKTTKNGRYVRSLGEKTHFKAYTEAKKCVVRSLLPRGLKIIQIPPGYQKKMFIV